MRRTLFETEHEAFRESFRRFLDKEVVPHHEEWEHGRDRRRARSFAAAGRHGFLGMAIPEEYGGGGVDDFRFNVVIGEEMQARRRRRRRPRHHAAQRHLPAVLPRATAPTSSRQRWLPGIASGELITAIAMTEPGTGSDLAGDADHARVRDGDDYVVNGSKTFITNGINADLVITAVKTDPDAAPPRACRCSSSSAAWTGFERGRNLDKIGHARPGHRRAVLHRRRACRSTNLLGEEGAGLRPPRRTTCRRSGCRSPSPASPRRAPRSTGRSSTSRSARRSASRSARSRTRRFVLAEMATEVEIAPALRRPLRRARSTPAS